MSINKEKLLADVLDNSTRKDMLETYKKLIPVAKGFRVSKDKVYVTAGLNEYEILDKELVKFLERNITEEYVPVTFK